MSGQLTEPQSAWRENCSRGGLTIGADGAGARRVAQHIGADLGVRDGAKREGGARDDKGRAVPRLRVVGAEEHGVSQHHEGRAANHEDLALVQLVRPHGNGQREEGTHGVGGDGVELLLDGRELRVDGPDDGRGEEGEALDGDVVEQEDEGRRQGDGADDAADELGLVDGIEDLGRGDALGLYAGDGEVLFFLR